MKLNKTETKILAYANHQSFKNYTFNSGDFGTRERQQLSNMEHKGLIRLVNLNSLGNGIDWQLTAKGITAATTN